MRTIPNALPVQMLRQVPKNSDSAREVLTFWVPFWIARNDPQNDPQTEPQDKPKHRPKLWACVGVYVRVCMWVW